MVHYCDVIESSDTEIKCRMRLDSRRKAGEQELIVFSSTFQEADCKAPDCKLKFLDSDELPTVQYALPAYDEATGKTLITVHCINITDADTSTIQAFIGGREQTIRSFSPTEVVIEVVDTVSGLTEKQFELYFW